MRHVLTGLLPLILIACRQVTNPEFADAEDAVKAALRDPESAKFSGEERCGESQIVLGRVNAKNVYGGYNGDVSFYYDGGSLTAFPLEENGPFNDTFVVLHRYDGISLLNRCTAAINATLPPKQRLPLQNDVGAMNVSDMNATDMNALDINIGSEESVAAAEAAIDESEIEGESAPSATNYDTLADDTDEAVDEERTDENEVDE